MDEVVLSEAAVVVVVVVVVVVCSSVAVVVAVVCSVDAVVPSEMAAMVAAVLEGSNGSVAVVDAVVVVSPSMTSSLMASASWAEMLALISSPSSVGSIVTMLLTVDITGTISRTLNSVIILLKPEGFSTKSRRLVTVDPDLFMMEFLSSVKLTPHQRLKIAVAPQGRANPLCVTGSPISSAETSASRHFCPRCDDNMYFITDGDSPVV